MKNGTRLLMLAAIAAALTITGCATVQDFHQNIIRSLRSPGETMVVNPEDTVLFHKCPEGGPDAPALLETDTIPNRVNPGEEVDHQIRYSLCVSDRTPAVKGEIIRTISFKGKILFRDRTDYDFKPGVWTVDAFVTVPAKASPGTYEVGTAIVTKKKTMNKNHAFQVKDRQDGK